MSKARELLLAEALDAAEYKAIKAECERHINYAEAKLAEAPTSQEAIEPILEKALYNLAHIDERFENGDVTIRREIIGSMFPEKLSFENEAYRTTRLNEAVQLIYNIGKAFNEKEKGQTNDYTSLSQEVIRIGFEPMTLSLEG